jgi:hypothetical protein
VVAARLGSDRPAIVIPVSKTFTPMKYIYILTVDAFESDGEHLLVHAQCFRYH